MDMQPDKYDIHKSMYITLLRNKNMHGYFKLKIYSFLYVAIVSLVLCLVVKISAAELPGGDKYIFIIPAARESGKLKRLWLLVVV
jgi:hypothetical protein